MYKMVEDINENYISMVDNSGAAVTAAPAIAATLARAVCRAAKGATAPLRPRARHLPPWKNQPAKVTGFGFR